MPSLNRLGILLLLISNSALAQQGTADSSGDPLLAACPGFAAHVSVTRAFDAWSRAEDLLHIEGDGAFGSNQGHTSEALPWLCKAAAAGNGHAAYDIARIFDEGYVINSRGSDGQVKTTHLPQDRRVAARWFEEAGNLGFTDGYIDLGLYYLRGKEAIPSIPFARDIDKGVALVSSAAGKGNTRAQLMLAYAYAPGVEPDSPVPKNRQIAAKWLARAQEAFKHFSALCKDPALVDLMVAQLPNPQTDRSTLSEDIQTVRTDNEVVCSLSLGAAADRRDTSATIFNSLLQGQMLRAWKYEMTLIPATDKILVRRETAAQALTDAAVNLAPLLNVLGDRPQK